MAAVHLIWKSSLIVGLLGLSFYWLKHRKLSLSQKALNYGLALLGYIWFMPESQKHSYSYLFLPLFLICDSAFPLGKSGNPFAKALFLLTVIVFILCSPGFIGEEWSRNVSLLSIPLITTFFMATFLILNREQASKD
jgi:hypothetical protein